MAGQKESIFRFSLGGLILIVLGILFLLNNLGVVSWGIWGILWRFWPVILILIGLNILWGRRNPAVVFLITAVLLVALVGAAVAIEGSRTSVTPTSFSQPLQGVERAAVEINFGAGDLLVGSLPADSTNLAAGTGAPGVDQDFRLRNGTAELELRVPAHAPFWYTGDKGVRLEAMLSPKVPLELTVKTGASNAQLNLTALRLTRLKVDTGASRLRVQLPAAAGTTEAEIRAGAAHVTVTIPPGVAARVTPTTGLGSFNIDTSRFPKVGAYYESPDYATASNRVNLRVDAGVSSVDIE
ncbi:MAG: DUF5668 domain-containing protein [Chloroflexota bacterium]